jgi:hypothetical protein
VVKFSVVYGVSIAVINCHKYECLFENAIADIKWNTSPQLYTGRGEKMQVKERESVLLFLTRSLLRRDDTVLIPPSPNRSAWAFANCVIYTKYDAMLVSYEGLRFVGFGFSFIPAGNARHFTAAECMLHVTFNDGLCIFSIDL